MKGPHQSPTLRGPRRVASIGLPKLAIERWRKSANASPDAPIALIIEAAHGQLIHAVTDQAAARGARPGMRLTDARALDPKLLAESADPAGDAALLKRLTRWAGRWSPLVEVDGEHGLRLDVSGIGHLFGGEEELAADIERSFAALGLTVRVAIAPTAAAAWAFSHFGLQTSIVTQAKAGVHVDASSRRSPQSANMDASLRWHDDKGLLEALAPLPVAALRLDGHAVQILNRLGLKTIGQLAAVPRKSLQRRFREADNPLDALDRALGHREEPLTAAAPEPAPRALVRLAEPATHAEAAVQALDRLVPGLARQLERRRLGARRLHLAGYRVDGSVAGTGVATAIPSRDPAHLHRLLRDKAAALDPGFGFDAFALTASWCEPLGAAQDSLVEEPEATSEVAKLVDRLSVKLGAQAVRRPVAVESHLPERANGWVSAVSSPAVAGEGDQRSWWRGSNRSRLQNPSTASGGPPPHELVGRMRPQRLLDRPEAIAVVYATPAGLPRRFVWRRAVHDIARVEGPERIAPEWWRERSSARLRDYYRVEDGEGRRYWIYREGVIGDGRGGAPGWYLHGLFG
jgi:protein ImuB